MKYLITCLLIPGFALATPVIETVTGNITQNAILTVGGSLFTEKANATPLFWWKADFGTSPSSMGRMAAWSDDDNLGSLSTTIVAPGSQQSFGTDHGRSSGIALSRVNFDSDQLYLYRKTYEDFDITTDEALRTNIKNLTGTLNVGDVITGSTSGATGKVVAIKGTTSKLIQYDNINGTINANPPVDFIRDEQMTSSSGAVMTSNENGVFRTFNFKTIRMWSKRYGNIYPTNNMHLNAQGLENSQFRITPESTDGTTWSGQFTNQVLHQLPREWKVEELQYQTSGISIKDGIFNFYQKGVLGTDNKFTNRKPDGVDSNGKTISRSRQYNSIVQSQVSHNAQPGSVMYYDSLYVDDSWHRVLLCSESSWSTRTNCEIQIPTTWGNQQIKINLNLGGLTTSSPLYLYVVDKEGAVNTNGFALQGSNINPKPPSPRVRPITVPMVELLLGD